VSFFPTFFKVAFFIKHSNPSFVFFTMIPTVLFTVTSRCCQTKTITSKTFQLRKHSYFDTFLKASCDAEKLCLCYFSSLSFYIPVFYCFFTIFFYTSKPFQRPRSCNSIICKKKCYKNDKKLHSKSLKFVQKLVCILQYCK